MDSSMENQQGNNQPMNIAYETEASVPHNVSHQSDDQKNNLDNQMPHQGEVNSISAFSLYDVFHALFTLPFTGSANDAVSLLSGKAKIIASRNANAEQCFLYLRAISLHEGHLLEVLLSSFPPASAGPGSTSIKKDAKKNDNDSNSQGCLNAAAEVSDVIQAAGCAASQCRHRSEISASGIIPVLARLAISCQSHTNSSNNIPPQPSTLSPCLDNNNPPYSTQFIHTQAHVLTAAHTEFLQACVSAGHYHYACEFTDKYPVLSAQPYKPITYVTAEQYLRYFYLLGIARLGMNRYQDAKLAFEIGITVPSRAVSAVTIACKKKYLLVKCLLLEEEKELLTFNNHNNNEDLNMEYTEDKVESVNRASGGENRTNNALTNRISRNQKRSMNPPKVVINQNQNQSTNTASESYQRRSLKDLIHEIPQCTYPVVSRFFNSSSSNNNVRGGDNGGIVGEDNDGIVDIQRDEYHHISAKESRSNSKNPKLYGIRVYNEIVDAFVENDIELFQKIKIQNEELLHADGNWGLVNQIQDEMELPRKLYKIAKLYEAIPISKLAKKLNLSSAEEAESVVREMMMKQSSIDTDGLKYGSQKVSFNAQIDDEEGVVYFLLKDRLVHDLESSVLTEQEELTSRIRKCMELTERMQNIDIALTTSSKYAGVFKFLPNTGTTGGNERGSGDGIRSTTASASVAEFSVEL